MPPPTRTSATSTPSSRARPTTRRCSSTRPTPAAQNKLSLVRELVGAARPPRRRSRPRRREGSRQAEPAKPAQAGEEAAKPRRPRSPRPPAARPPTPRAEVLKAVNGWARGVVQEGRRWLSRLLRQGLQDPRGEARADWEKSRRARIAAPKSIAVGVESPKVTMNGADQATVPSARATGRTCSSPTAARRWCWCKSGRPLADPRREERLMRARASLPSLLLRCRARWRAPPDAGRPAVRACSKSIEAQPPRRGA